MLIIMPRNQTRIEKATGHVFPSSIQQFYILVIKNVQIKSIKDKILVNYYEVDKIHIF